MKYPQNSHLRLSLLIATLLCREVAFGQVSLNTIPATVYNTSDTRIKNQKNDCFYFNILVNSTDTTISPYWAKLELYSGRQKIKTIEYSKDALDAIKTVSFKKNFIQEKELFDFLFFFSEPTKNDITTISGRFDFKNRVSKIIEQKIIIPIKKYSQKTKLIFPLKGNLLVVNGNVTEGGHTERSQQYAYDIIGLGNHMEYFKTDGQQSKDYYGWGLEVIAPAAGKIVYARNDVADNDSAGKFNLKMLLSLPDPQWAIAGNCVVIDHLNGEYSFLAHMQKGSVKVKVGDLVNQGDLIGLLGSSGHAEGPHLHYHLMNGSIIYKSDGLPSIFENVESGRPKQSVAFEVK